MNKFKVGDRIVGNKKADKYIITRHGWKGEVIDVCDNGAIIVKGDNIYFQVAVDEECFDLLNTSSGELHITVKDNITHAIYKRDGEVIKRSQAICSPSDEFNFETGARLAIDRLFDDKPKKPRFKVGDKVRVVANEKGHQFDIGEIVRIIRVFDNGNYKAEYLDGLDWWFMWDEELEPYTEPKQEPIKLCCVRDFMPGVWLTKGKVYTKDNNGKVKMDDGYKTSYIGGLDGTPFKDYFVPLVSRPAKVGETILIIDEGYHKPELEVGDLHVITKVWADGDASTDKGNVFAEREQEEYLVLDGYQPEPEYYSGKVVCVGGDDLGLTKGKVYTVKNGMFAFDTEAPVQTEAKTFDELNGWFLAGEFIEYKGEAEVNE